MKIRTVESIQEIKACFGLVRDGALLENDLDIVENECELNERKRRDAEVLCTLAANARGNCLDLGTSHGRSAFKLGSNLPSSARVFTVNILPEQHDATGGQLITHLLSRDEIGSYYRERGLTNIEQIFANTAGWNIPPEINDLSLVFVDAAHDTELVYSDSMKIYDRIQPGGFICWHDFCPELRSKYDWIDAVMRGVEKFLAESCLDAEVVHLRHSWIGVLRKPKADWLNGSARLNRRAADALLQTVFQAAVAGTVPPPDLSRLKSLRYVLAYPAYSQERTAEEEGYCKRIREQCGYEVKAFPLFCPGGWWPFPKLDEAWKRKDSGLMTAYDRLSVCLRPGDVLIASGGSMLHPEFLRQLPSFNIFTCADDPESSEVLSRPVAPAFDFCFPFNLSCVDAYRAWGCKHVDWLYHAIRPELTDPTLSEEKILTETRDLDIILLCENYFGLSDRAKRIELLLKEFPQAFVRGRGWPGGHVAPELYYPRAKIGWNFHHSTGPVNSRVVTLPAFGVMQICDNKQHLAKLFKLDEEIVGFDTLEECAEKTRYYLAHDEERRRVAAAGWKRATTEFTEARQWERMVSCVAPVHAIKFPNLPDHSRLGASALGSVLSSTESFDPKESRPARCPSSVSGNSASKCRTRVLLLADRPGWAYDHVAQAISKRLADEFEFRIEYVSQEPDLNAWGCDLLYVFFWGETYHRKFVQDSCRVIKEISSHRWALEDHYGRLTPAQAAERYLSDAGTLTATSKRLQTIFHPHRPVHLTPNGFEPEEFKMRNERRGKLRIGWAGNEKDLCKGLNDILRPAAAPDFEIEVAGGGLSKREMSEFYNQIDVLCVASTAEGSPLPLLEGMACGCFPVCVDVGVVPELVRHKQNGLIVSRNTDAFRAAFQWCATNPEVVRQAGRQNAQEILRVRSWDAVANCWRRAFRNALSVSTPRSTISPSPAPADNLTASSESNQVYIPVSSSPGASSKEANTKSGAIDELKSNYFDHLKNINPAEQEAVYRNSQFYYRAELMPLLPPDKTARCLDLGCGFGHLLRFVAEQGYRRCGGVELDERLYRACVSYIGNKVELLERNDASEFLRGYKDIFDFITLFDVIEHFSLQDGLTLCRLIFGALKPGGRLVLRTPNMANVFGIYSRYIDLTHQIGFTEQSLKQLTRQAGFAESDVLVPEWDPANPLTAKLRESAEFHRNLFSLQDRATPKCYEKNIVLWARK